MKYGISNYKANMFCLWKKKRKLVLSSAICMLLIHMVKFTNCLYNWDSVLMGIDLAYSDMRPMGRWFAAPISIFLSTHYDLQWVEGVICCLFFGISMAVLFSIIQVRNNAFKLISIFLMASFPPITATLTYLFWAPAYMFSFMIAMIALYLMIYNTTKKSILISSILICFSLSIYQVYFTAALVCFLIWIIKNIFYQDIRNTNQLLQVVRRVLFGMLGGVSLYAIITKIIFMLTNTVYTDYQGISTAGQMSLQDLFKGAYYSIKQCGKFFLGTSDVTLYGVFNIFFLLVLIYTLFQKVLMNKQLKIKNKFIIIFLICLIFPITYIFYFVSKTTYYHMLMQIGMYFVYLLIIVFNDSEEKFDLPVQKMAGIILLFLAAYNTLNANTAYKQMEISNNRTQFEIETILNQIDKLGYTSNGRIVLVGLFSEADMREDSIKAIPSITGASTNNFIMGTTRFVYYTNYYYNRNFTVLSNEEVLEISNKTEVKNMPSFPSEGYIKQINDVIVVKLPN